MKEITEKTALPISLIIVVVTGVIWAVRLESEVKASVSAMQSCPASLGAINERLARIEGMISEHMRREK